MLVYILFEKGFKSLLGRQMCHDIEIVGTDIHRNRQILLGTLGQGHNLSQARASGIYIEEI